MRNFSKAVLGLLGVALGGCATGPDLDANVPKDLAAPLQAHFMPAGRAADMPAGYVSFCIRFADQCETSPNSSITLNQASWTALNRVNLSVNSAIWPVEDLKHYGRAEYWTIPTDGEGDCEDIALTKRQQLARAGYPLSALRIAVVETPQMERHAILTVATDEGDLVLDNLNDQVKVWSLTGYRWIERQDPRHRMQWVTVEDNPVLMASANHQDPAPTGQVSR